MFYDKRYLQFNNLVFDGYDMISSTDEQTTYKESQAQSYSYGHGSYQPYKSDFMYVNSGSVSMTLTFHMKKIPCEDRPWYLNFIDQELGRPGKLWAIRNNEVMWAYANVRSKHPITTNEAFKAEYDIEFTLPEGIWHKADKQRTFVLPYNVCTMMECKGFEPYDPCCSCDGCEERKMWESFQDRCFCCCVDDISEDMALCYHMKEIQKFYGCETPFQLVYSCTHAEKFKHEDFLGRRICVEDICDSNLIAGRFYSDTDIPTDDVTVILKGKAHDPEITINDNTNIIKGDYDGTLRIEPSGDVYYTTDDGCETLLDPSVWQIPKGQNYGWTVYPQSNSVIVKLNECCGATCVYIDSDSITA